MPGLRGKPAVMMAMSELAVGCVVVGARHIDVIALHRPGLQQVEPFALRNAFHDVHEDDVGQFLVGDANCTVRADVTGAHNGDLVSQVRILLSV